MLLNEHSGLANSVSFSTDGKLLASGLNDKTVKVWSLEEGRELYTLSGHANSVNSISFSPDRKFLVSGSGDNSAKLWHLEERRVLETFLALLSLLPEREP